MIRPDSGLGSVFIDLGNSSDMMKLMSRSFMVFGMGMLSQGGYETFNARKCCSPPDHGGGSRPYRQPVLRRADCNLGI